MKPKNLYALTLTSAAMLCGTGHRRLGSGP